jgi:hypothetical protein
MVAMMEMTGEMETPVTESMGASGGSARDVDNAAGRVPGSKRPEFFERLREGRGRVEVPESGSAPAQPVRRNKSKKRELPPQSEIAQITYESVEFERAVEKKVHKRVLKEEGGFWKSPTYETMTETITETVKKEGYRFCAQAVGPQGRYVAGVSPEFEITGDWPYVYRRNYSHGREYQYYVPKSADAEAALNALLSKLWSEGWQPTSWGQFWYDFRLRRVVPRSERSPSRASSAPGERSDS